LEALRKCRKLNKLREALKSLPKTLDDTYARILCNIDEEDCQDAVKILQWLTCSARPLQIEEVAEVVAVDIECDPRFDPGRRLREAQDILAICSSLVTTTSETTKGSHDKTMGRQIRLAHFSVKEYLVSERVQATRYRIQEIRANVSIAEICLAYLLQFDSPDSLTSQTIEEFPLARYAARYWTQHAQLAGKDTGKVHLLIMELFLSKRDAYVNWIRLFNPDYPWKEPTITESLDKVACPLYYASLAGLVESARLLLEDGADANAQGGEYGNALQAASAGGHEKVVQQLLDKGADVNAQGGPHGNALQAASAGGHEKVVQRLLDKGADVKSQGGFWGNALQAASAGGHNQVVQWLLDKGADINVQGGYYGNALQAASLEGRDQVVQQLLDKGASVNAQGGFWGNALQAASFKGHDQVVRRLLDKGADVNAQGGFYGNALQAASVKGHDPVVQRLLDKGATQSE
jgi:ankyrin repeat protein